MTVIITIHFLHTHLSSAGAFVFMASIVLLTDCASCTFRPGWPAKQIALNSQNAQIAKKKLRMAQSIENIRISSWIVHNSMTGVPLYQLTSYSMETCLSVWKYSVVDNSIITLAPETCLTAQGVLSIQWQRHLEVAWPQSSPWQAAPNASEFRVRSIKASKRSEVPLTLMDLMEDRKSLDLSRSFEL